MKKLFLWEIHSDKVSLSESIYIDNLNYSNIANYMYNLYGQEMHNNLAKMSQKVSEIKAEENQKINFVVFDFSFFGQNLNSKKFQVSLSKREVLNSYQEFSSENILDLVDKKIYAFLEENKINYVGKANIFSYVTLGHSQEDSLFQVEKSYDNFPKNIDFETINIFFSVAICEDQVFYNKYKKILEFLSFDNNFVFYKESLLASYKAGQKSKKQNYFLLKLNQNSSEIVLRNKNHVIRHKNLFSKLSSEVNLKAKSQQLKFLNNNLNLDLNSSDLTFLKNNLSDLAKNLADELSYLPIENLEISSENVHLANIMATLLKAQKTSYSVESIFNLNQENSFEKFLLNQAILNSSIINSSELKVENQTVTTNIKPNLNKRWFSFNLFKYFTNK
ncbi:hypothetical protein [Mycoplasmopsis synoviae]|uniref:hypothetical protein n=1 Tax=Mycoplasmopsis synoviae TaxID=2109 RepID=UPI001CE17361|nr:hypothetical protein [Mycoplasmopsis synoviae]UBX97309.1 hypothetical protein K6989_02915 [Mycoplasmopsis synoviae]UBX97998.1 hypothetical protein K6987_03140 [Mycoplasmopsis synoviae]UBX99306.1 hypothetical protein K6988_03240 [Mycoplasmopsis synoviae]UBY00244.1 hypothetical protein K6990_01255 [Mycoplasmopsis synoviae]